MSAFLPTAPKTALALAGALLALVAGLAQVAGPARAAETQSPAPLRIVAFGDSLTAGFNLPEAAAFPKALERRLIGMGYRVTIANAGVSGDTSGAGLERLDWSIPDETQLVIVELGANDMLRALDPALARKNLTAIAERLKARKIPFVLAGMKAIANWGADYQARFDAIYGDLSAAYDAPLYPFFMDGVVGVKALQLADGLHPNAQGVERIVDGFAPFLAGVIDARFGGAYKSAGK